MNFDKIYADHYDTVFSFCKFRIHDEMTAEELTSNVMLKVHNNLVKFDAEKSALKTWIMNIAKNTIIDYWRTNKQGMFKSLSDFTDDDGNEFLQPTDNITPESQYENNELGNSIMDAIIELPENYQNVIDGFLIEQKSYEEISIDLDIPLGTVKGRISRAKEMLRNKLINL